MRVKILLLFIIIGLSPFLFDKAYAKKYRVNTPGQEQRYQKKVLKKLEKEKYEKSLLPQSGYMTKEEYEKKSQDIAIDKIKIPEPKIPLEVGMEYVPQSTFKLSKYNSPPGTPEIKLDRKFYYDRQVNAQGIASPDFKFMVYPSVYYYALSQCTAVDLFEVPLEGSLSNVDKILRANIVKRNPKPIMSTEKSISEKGVFRSLTPVDFSQDAKRLIVKEKTGYVYDGIWKTSLWVYDFETKQARKISEIRAAIKFYWRNTTGCDLDDRRWDIYPLGFDADDDSRIIVSAYGYTGSTPKYLGLWSVDVNGERSMLLSLFESDPRVSVNGYKVVKDGVVNPNEVYKAKKKDIKALKKKRKEAKKEKSKIKKEARKEYHKRLKELGKESNSGVKQLRPTRVPKFSAPTGLD